MKIEMEVVNGVAVVSPHGLLMGGPDTAELDDRLYSLLGRGMKHVVLDLAHTRWINSSGLSVLIHQWKNFQSAGADLRLANLTQKAHHVLVISKLTSVFSEFDSVDDAVNSFTDSSGTATRPTLV